MGRPARGYWDARSGRYYTRLFDPETGRKRAYLLKHADGRHIARGDAGAVAAAVQRLLADRERDAARAAGPTVAELCADFVAWHRDNGSAGRTVADHTYHLRRFAAFTHGGVMNWDRPAAAIGPEDLWRIKQAGLGSLRLLYASVLACWRWAARPVEGRTPAQLLARNPLAGLAKPPRGKIVEKTLPWPVVRRLLRVARAHARTRTLRFRRDAARAAERLRVLALAFVAVTGCRPHEAAALEWSELRWEEGLAVIPAEKTKTRKTGRDRRIAVPAGLVRCLRAAARWEGRHPRYVFLAASSRARGVPKSAELINWFRDTVRPAALAAGVPLPPEATLYWMRHSWQSTGVEVATAERVAAAAGNSPQVLLATYAHKRNRDIRAVANQVQRRRRAGG